MGVAAQKVVEVRKTVKVSEDTADGEWDGVGDGNARNDGPLGTGKECFHEA